MNRAERDLAEIGDEVKTTIHGKNGRKKGIIISFHHLGWGIKVRLENGTEIETSYRFLKLLKIKRPVPVEDYSI